MAMKTLITFVVTKNSIGKAEVQLLMKIGVAAMVTISAVLVFGSARFFEPRIDRGAHLYASASLPNPGTHTPLATRVYLTGRGVCRVCVCVCQHGAWPARMALSAERLDDRQRPRRSPAGAHPGRLAPRSTDS